MIMKRKLSIISMICGAALIIGAVSLFLYNSWDEKRASEAAVQTAESLAVLISERRDASPVIDPDREQITDPAEHEPSENRAPHVYYQGESYLGVLSIPALGLSLPVTEAWSYAKLKASPCRYIGSAEGGDFVIMAHNYKRHFGNISLLGYGDTVIFTDADGTAYEYIVDEIETVNSTDVDHMIDSEYELTLFTCTYGGAARVAVRCIREI